MAAILREKLDSLVSFALHSGATRALAIDASVLRVDPRVRLKCQVPLCPNYGRNLMCPPRLPAVKEAEDALGRYRKALLIQVEVRPTAGPAAGDEAVRAQVYDGASVLHRIVNAVEKQAFQRGFPLAAGLIGGTCRLCETCVAAEGGGACRHPFEARPSMEGMGIDVVRALRELGFGLEFPATNLAAWTGCVLLD